MNQLPLTIHGRVITGIQNARTLGYPTANIELQQPLQIPQGVYIAHTKIEQQLITFASVVFYGSPYIGEEKLETRFEVHLLEYAPHDLYGSTMSVQLLSYVRPTERFHSLEELKKAIENDIKKAREYFTNVYRNS